MIAVKERVTTLVVVKPETKSERKTSSRQGGPPDPPEPPGGRRRREEPNRTVLYLVAIFLSVIFWLATASSYSILLGDTVAAQVIELLAWFVLIVAVGKCCFRDRPDTQPAQNFDEAIQKAIALRANRYWDGMLLVILVFHLAVYAAMLGPAQIAGAAAILATLAFWVELVRLRISFPETQAEFSELLSSTRLGHAPPTR